jgi:regulatory protein
LLSFAVKIYHQLLEKRKKQLTTAIVLQKLQSYCAYQERCLQEITAKCYDLGVEDTDLQEKIIDALIENNFLNEARFAIAFAGGKFRVKQWGKIRIFQELKSRHIAESDIFRALDEINADVYQKTFEHLFESKQKDYEDTPQGKAQLANFLLRKGYEPALIWARIRLNLQTHRDIDNIE